MHSVRKRQDPAGPGVQSVGLPVAASERGQELFGGHNAPVRQDNEGPWTRVEERASKPSGELQGWRAHAEDTSVFIKRNNLDDLGVTNMMPSIMSPRTTGRTGEMAQEVLYKSMGTAAEAGRANSLSPVRSHPRVDKRGKKLQGLQRRMEDLDGRVEDLLSERRRSNAAHLESLQKGEFTGLLAEAERHQMELKEEQRAEKASGRPGSGGGSARSSPIAPMEDRDTARLGDGRAPAARHRPGRTLRPLDLGPSTPRGQGEAPGPGPGSRSGELAMSKTARGRLERLECDSPSLPFRDDVAELRTSMGTMMGEKVLGGTWGKTGHGKVPGAEFDGKGGLRGDGGEERNLAWVRRMVQFVENNPVVCVRKDFLEGRDLMGGGGAPGLDEDLAAAAADLDLPIPERMVFPSLSADRREDVLLLENWLADMLGCVDVELPSGTEGDQADAAMWLYRLAFEEVRRQVEVGCRERGQLLGRLWSHFFVIVEMRNALRYEGDIYALARELEVERERTRLAQQQVDNRVKDTGSMEAAYREKIAKMERELGKLGKRTVRAEQDADKARADMKEMNQRMMDAIQARTDTEKELADTREALEEQRLIAEEMALEAEEHRKISKQLEDTLREKEKLLHAKGERLENAERMIKHLETEREENKAAIAKITTKLEKEIRAHDQLKHEMKEKNVMMANQVERETELQSLVDAANTEKTAMQKVIDAMKADLAATRESRTKTEVMYDKLHVERDQLLYDLEKLTKATGEETAKFEEIIAEASKKKVVLETDIAAKAEVILGLERERERFIAEIDRFKHEVRDVRMFCRRYDTMMEDERRLALSKGEDSPLLQSNVSAAQQRRAAKNTAAGGAGAASAPESVLPQRRGGVDEWETFGTAGKAQRVLAEMERGFKDMVAALASARHNEEVMRLRFEAGEKAVREMEERSYDEKMELQRLRQQLNGTTKDGDKVGQRLEEERQRLRDAEEELHSTKMSLHDARLEVKELTTRCFKVDTLEVANKELVEQLHDEQKALQNEKLMHEGVQKQLAQETALLEKEQHEMAQLRTRSNNLVEQIDYLSRHVTSKVSQLEETRAEFASTQGDLKAEREQFAQMEQALTTANQALEQQLSDERNKSETLQARLLKAAELLQLSRFWLQGLQQEENFEDVLHTIDKVTKDVKIPEVTPPVWMYRLKIGVLSASHHALRTLLAQEIHRRLSNEARHLQDALAYERKLATALKERYAMEREVMSQQHAAVKDLQGQMRQIRKTCRHIGKNTRNIMDRLIDWDTKFDNRVDASTTAEPDDIIMAPMSLFLSTLRPDWPPNTNTERGRARARTTIVQVYNSYLAAVAEKEEIGAEGEDDDRFRMDTIFDALRVTFSAMFDDTRPSGGAWGGGAEVHMGDFCRGLRALLREDPKALLFARFMGVEEDREPLSRPTFTFFMTVLDCLRRLLGASWRPLMITWEDGDAAVPRACVMDLLTNVYNTNDPESLPLTRRLAPLLQKGADEVLMVDLDKLLLILVGEYETQQCPRDPLRSPRRVPEVKYVYAPLGAASQPSATQSKDHGGSGGQDGPPKKSNVEIILNNVKRHKHTTAVQGGVFEGIHEPPRTAPPGLAPPPVGGG